MTLAPSLWVVMLALQAQPAGAAPPSDERPVTWTEALEIARRTGAVDGVARAAKAKGQLEQELSPVLGNPEFELLQGYVDDPDPGLAGSYTQLSVRLPLSLSGLSQAQRQAASAETRTLATEAFQRALDRRLEAAAAWLRLWSAQAALEHAQTEETLAADFRSKVEGAHALGGTTRLEVAEARTYAAEAKLFHLDVEGELVEARLELARVLGLPTLPTPRAEGTPPPLAPNLTAGEETELMAASGRVPAVVQQRLSAQAAEARIREARALSGWQLKVGAEGYLQAGRYPAAFGLLSVTPPLFDRGTRQAAHAAADLARAEGQLREEQAGATSHIAALIHEVEHANAVHAVLDGELVPSAEEAAQLATLLFDHGQSSVLDVLRARRSLAAAQRRLVSGRSDAALAALRLQLLREATR